MSSTIVTGGLGNVGQWIVEHLTQNGHHVTILDVEYPGFHVEHSHPDISYRSVDLSDQGKTADIVRSIDPDNVIHLAAINSMGRSADSEVFETNVMTTYNVLQSAGWVDANVAVASSEAVYGMAFATDPWLPDYLPVDEDHPRQPADEYGSSKLVSEEIGKTMARKYNIQVASIRLTWIQYPPDYMCVDRRDDLSMGVNQLWSYLDIRDAGSVFRSAVESDFEGHETFLATAEDTYLDRPSQEAVETYFGHVPEKCNLEGNEALFTTRKADEILDWSPVYSWRSVGDDPVPEPDFLET
jgi:nucleoside-diphosphate-sugar epimerase